MPRNYKYSSNYINSISELLIEQVDGSYIQKTGKDFIDSFKKYIADKLTEKKSNNLNLYTVEQVESSPLIDELNFSGIKDFKLLGELSYQKLIINADNTYTNQKLYIENLDETNKNIYEKSKGILYMIVGVIDNKKHIIKFGQTRKTLEERIGSYNCGTIKNIGTASTTNVFILQSIIASDIKYEVYYVDCSDFIERFKWYDQISKSFASSKSLAFENIILQQYIKQFNEKPLGNTQAEIDNSTDEDKTENDDES